MQRLTTRQWEIGVLIAKGLTNKQIGNALNISEGTVKLHASLLFKKLGINRRGGLAEAMQKNSAKYGNAAGSNSELRVK